MQPRAATRFTSAALALLAFAGAGWITPRETIAGSRAPRRTPLIVLASPPAGERSVEAADLTFAYYRRTVYTRRAPRRQTPGGQRTEVEDRRRDCRCFRFRDWSKKKFKRLRQIEISYPAGSDHAMVRITRQNGDVREFPATELYGAEGSFPPRLVASVDGARREYPLVLGGDAGEAWPEEKPVRILLVGSAAPRRR